MKPAPMTPQQRVDVALEADRMARAARTRGDIACALAWERIAAAELEQLERESCS